MKIEVKLITPAIATTLLASGPPNRKLIRRRVAELAEAMTNGDWRQDGAPIRLAEDGSLLDGQHRLAAVVQSQAELEFIVISGIEEDARLVMDTGKLRSFEDHLTMNGVANGRSLAAATRFLWNYEAGVFEYKGNYIQRPTPTMPGLWKLYLDRRDALEQGVSITQNVIKYIRITPGIAGGLWPVLSAVDFDDASEFYDQLAERSDTTPFDGVLLLRRRLNNAGRKDYGDRLSQRIITALVIKAWNAYRRGNPISQLRWNPGGANPESFPQPL